MTCKVLPMKLNCQLTDTAAREAERPAIRHNRISYPAGLPGTSGEFCTSMPSIPRIDWSASGNLLLIYSPGDPLCGQSPPREWTLWHPKHGRRLASIELHGSLVSVARISADGMRILIGLAEPHPVHGSFWQLDHQSGSIRSLMNCGSCAGITSVAESGDGPICCTAAQRQPA